MRVPLLAVSLWLLAVPLGAGAQAPPQSSSNENPQEAPVTGDTPAPGAPQGVGEHEHPGHPVPPGGAVGVPPAMGGSGTATVTPAAPDETKPAACPCQSADATGPCPCPHQQGAQAACPCMPEGATGGTCPCPHHAEHMAQMKMQMGKMGTMMCRPVGKSAPQRGPPQQHGGPATGGSGTDYGPQP